jgi:CubicO group peptidase (beta-lactamase class C family)
MIDALSPIRTLERPMTRLTKHLIRSLLTLLIATTSMAAEPNLDDPAQLEIFIDGVVKPLMKANNSPAGTVAIARRGELILAKGYGFEDIEQRIPVDPHETLFRPGSTSKLFTWVSSRTAGWAISLSTTPI